MSPEPVPIVRTDHIPDWQSVADELADALRTAMLRNPAVTARNWLRASNALERYDGATRGATELSKPSKT